MDRFLLISFVALLASCGPIDPPPPTDEEGEVIPMPGPFDTWLGVESVEPDGGELGPRPTIRVKLDNWLDLEELLDFSVGRLSSGGLSYSGRVRWIMTTRTLEFTPFSDLEPGLRYTLAIDGARLFSVTGAPFRGRSLPDYVVTPDGAEPEPVPEPESSWEAVDALFESKCRSCHADPQWQLNPLTRESLLGARSEQRDAILVVPYRPSESYLMHKILPDYPVRSFTVQPPPWSGLEVLEQKDLFLIERWIAQGAE